MVTNNIILQYVLDEKRSSENCEFYLLKKMILKKAKNLCHVMRDRGFDLRGDVLDLILEGEILRLQLRSIWARRFEMLR